MTRSTATQRTRKSTCNPRRNPIRQARNPPASNNLSPGRFGAIIDVDAYTIHAPWDEPASTSSLSSIDKDSEEDDSDFRPDSMGATGNATPSKAAPTVPRTCDGLLIRPPANLPARGPQSGSNSAGAGVPPGSPYNRIRPGNPNVCSPGGPMRGSQLGNDSTSAGVPPGSPYNRIRPGNPNVCSPGGPTHGSHLGSNSTPAASNALSSKPCARPVVGSTGGSRPGGNTTTTSAAGNVPSTSAAGGPTRSSQPGNNGTGAAVNAPPNKPCAPATGGPTHGSQPGSNNTSAVGNAPFTTATGSSKHASQPGSSNTSVAGGAPSNNPRAPVMGGSQPCSNSTTAAGNLPPSNPSSLVARTDHSKSIRPGHPYVRPTGGPTPGSQLNSDSTSVASKAPSTKQVSLVPASGSSVDPSRPGSGIKAAEASFTCTPIKSIGLPSGCVTVTQNASPIDPVPPVPGPSRLPSNLDNPSSTSTGPAVTADPHSGGDRPSSKSNVPTTGTLGSDSIANTSRPGTSSTPRCPPPAGLSQPGSGIKSHASPAETSNTHTPGSRTIDSQSGRVTATRNALPIDPVPLVPSPGPSRLPSNIDKPSSTSTDPAMANSQSGGDSTSSTSNVPTAETSGSNPIPSRPALNFATVQPNTNVPSPQRLRQPPPSGDLDMHMSVFTRFATWLETQRCAQDDVMLHAVERDGQHFLRLAKVAVTFDDAVRGRVPPTTTTNDTSPAIRPLSEHARTLRAFVDLLKLKISQDCLSEELKTAVLRDGQAFLRLAQCCLVFNKAIHGLDPGGS